MIPENMKTSTILLSVLMSIGLICYILNFGSPTVLVRSRPPNPKLPVKYVHLRQAVCGHIPETPINSAASGIANCPMNVIKHIIVRTTEFVSNDDAPLQMQIIRRIMEDIYGGNWGVLIIKEPELISSVIHWTFPDHRHRDGSAAFCLHVERGWQYNVFKTGDIDTEDRLTVEKTKFIPSIDDKESSSGSSKRWDCCEE
uniref:Uncharacterized protein n=1 Tax=Globodera rostochiensis TaxID=31243 RepID=A0A914HYN5_GLORO